MSVTGRILFGLAVTALHSGCGEKLDPLRPSLEPPPAKASAPCWERDIQPLLKTRCLICHGPSGSHDFSTLPLARLSMEAIRSKVRSEQMPPDSPLDSAKSNLLLRWVQEQGPSCAP